MSKEFHQVTWDAHVEDDCRQIIRLAVREDLERQQDWTTLALCPGNSPAELSVVVREDGVVAGQAAARLVLDETGIEAQWEKLVADGTPIAAGTAIAKISGNARHLLTVERLVLNLMSRLSGIATMTRCFVQAIEEAGGGARIYDTRKTTPGWRRLEKYAVGCGGGRNHRTGLFDAVLIKDNHLCLARDGDKRLSPAECVVRTREFVKEALDDEARARDMIVEIEVDTLEQLRDVLPAGPDIVLLDNMTVDQLREGVALRNELRPSVELEASGGITLETVGAISRTGVERISSGALTQSGMVLDIGLDWT